MENWRVLSAGGIFDPLEGETTFRLLDYLWRYRTALILAAPIAFSRRFGGGEHVERFRLAVHRFCSLDQKMRLRLAEDPPMRILLKQIGETIDGTNNHIGAVRLVNEFERILEERVQVLETIGEEEIELVRNKPDPLVASVSSPTYTFSSSPGERVLNAGDLYTLEFFESVLSTVRYRIGMIWPKTRLLIPRLVKTIVHLPDFPGRSCSAARYAGVVFLSAGDSSLIKVEESIVHEYGHQVLYCVLELGPFVVDDRDRMFVLPWSGSQRDVYGLLHATYIYLLLAMYYAAAEGRHSPDDAYIASRRNEILTGLDEAIPMLADSKLLTDDGEEFVRRLEIFSRGISGRPRPPAIQQLVSTA